MHFATESELVKKQSLFLPHFPKNCINVTGSRSSVFAF